MPLQVMVLEPPEMLRMKSADFHSLTNKTVGSIISRIAVAISFVDKQQQQNKLLTKTAEERYEMLLKKYPGIQNRIAQIHIASYIGINPQSISRIRRQRT